MKTNVKKTIKRSFALVLVFCVILQEFVLGVNVSNVNERVENNPYELMYDSNIKLSDRIESMPDFAIDNTKVYEDQTASIKPDSEMDVVAEDVSNISVSDERMQDKQQIKEKILELAQTGDMEEIGQLNIPDRLKTIALIYDAMVFDIVDLCAFTYEKELTTGAIKQTGITITSFSPGEIIFEVDRDIPQGNKWSGVLDIISLRALSSQNSIIRIES